MSWWNWSTNTIQKHNVDDLRTSMTDNTKKINTITERLQTCLITGTIDINNKVKVLNDYLKKQQDKMIIIY